MSPGEIVITTEEYSKRIITDLEDSNKGLEDAIVSRPQVYTHAGWSEHMAFATGVACNSIGFYHGNSLSLQKALSQMNRKNFFISKERE